VGAVLVKVDSQVRQLRVRRGAYAVMPDTGIFVAIAERIRTHISCVAVRA
jgi:hypothetical protein